MKKNKMMRVASVLLVAVLLTTSLISGTFAKYVTSDSKTDSARVAKFGVAVSATGDLFSKTYKRVNDGNTPGTAETDHTLTNPDVNGFSMTVESSNSDDKNLVAPGTKNDTGLKLSVSGAPEVDVRVKYDLSRTSDVYLGTGSGLPDMTKTNGGTFDIATEYHPIVFTLTGNYLKTATLTNITGLDVSKKESEGKVSGSIAAIAAVLEALNGGADGQGIYVDANTELSTAIGDLTLTWEWIFEDTTTTGDDGAAKLLRDQEDTLLGDIAAGTVIAYTAEPGEGKTALPEGYTNYSTEIGITLTVTVTQVD